MSILTRSRTKPPSVLGNVPLVAADYPDDGGSERALLVQDNGSRIGAEGTYATWISATCVATGAAFSIFSAFHDTLGAIMTLVLLTTSIFMGAAATVSYEGRTRPYDVRTAHPDRNNWIIVAMSSWLSILSVFVVVFFVRLVNGSLGL